MYVQIHFAQWHVMELGNRWLINPVVPKGLLVGKKILFSKKQVEVESSRSCFLSLCLLWDVLGCKQKNKNWFLIKAICIHKMLVLRCKLEVNSNTRHLRYAYMFSVSCQKQSVTVKTVSSVVTCGGLGKPVGCWYGWILENSQKLFKRVFIHCTNNCVCKQNWKYWTF